ncbi:Reverse transcriptase domain [Trinorchestia longiramus]|nr:Reverse transcriptase domain [Trinorchestia longiramus]
MLPRVSREFVCGDIAHYRSSTAKCCCCKRRRKMKQVHHYLKCTRRSRYKLLLGEQAEFRRGKSTMDSLLIAKDFIANTFFRKQICVAVYLDLDGAYDSVWHEGIIYKLIASGLEKTYVNWIKNYLTGRTASVRLGAVQSEGVPITWGLPQGAVLIAHCFSTPCCQTCQLLISTTNYICR